MTENTVKKIRRSRRTPIERVKIAAVEAAKKGDWSFLDTSDELVSELFRDNHQLVQLVVQEVEDEGFEILSKLPQEVIEELMNSSTTSSPTSTSDVPPEVEEEPPVTPAEETEETGFRAPEPYSRAENTLLKETLVKCLSESRNIVIYGAVMVLSIFVFLVSGSSWPIAMLNLLQMAGPAVAGIRGVYLSAFRPQKVLWWILLLFTTGSLLLAFIGLALTVAMLLQSDENDDWQVPPADGEWYHIHPLTRLGLVDITRESWLYKRDKTLELYNQQWLKGEPSVDLSKIGNVDFIANLWSSIWRYGTVTIEVQKEGKNDKLSFRCPKHFGKQWVKDLQALRDWTCQERGIGRFRPN